ncbi:MAG: cupin domain-containing protein [bacterium]
MQPINLQQKFALIGEYWSPKIVAALNGQQVKLAKLRGEFVWHRHEEEDELFLVVKGKLCIEFRDHEAWLRPGELLVVSKGVEHKPVAEEEVHVLLFEPASTLNTGNQQSERTVENPEWI